MTVAVFIATSLDGFIARPDGAIDWLPAPPEEGDGFGYHAFMERVDTLVLGRHTYETVRGFGPWPYGDKRVVVLTTTGAEIPPALADRVVAWDAAPEEVVGRIAAQGGRRVYLDGGLTIQRFMAAGLVDELVVTRVPVLLGDGRPLFGPLDGDVRLVHVETAVHDGGLVQSRYWIEGRDRHESTRE